MKKHLLFILSFYVLASTAQNLDFNLAGRYTDGRDGACEISAYDKDSQKLFVTNAASDSIDIVSLADIANPTKVGGINVLNYGGGVNSVVNLKNGHIAAAIEAVTKQDSGKVIIFDVSGNFVSEVTVGALPDMVTITPDGNKILVANEGEPDDTYANDPNGSVSVIDISGGVQNLSAQNVTHINFDDAPQTIEGSLQKPGTTFAQDLEPEYIAVNESSTIAVVSCQESNVFIFIDLTNNMISSYKGLGFKDHSIEGNGFDASNKDDIINITTHNVKGVYMPDAISSINISGSTYWLTANEGDGRDYDGYSSETRIKDLTLDETAFPNAVDLQENEALGRLKTFTADYAGDTDNDGDVDELYCYGARSFSIRDLNGDLVYDSGDDFEQYIAVNHPSFFNCDDGLAEEFDERSDDKGSEPEAITTGTINNTHYAFIGLERQGGIFVYDITTPSNPSMVDFVHTFNETEGTMTDIAPEGIVFVPADESHNGKNLLIVSHEVSGTTSIYEITSTSSVKEMLAQNVEIYPNPAKNIINISFVNNTNSNYQLINSLGVCVMSGQLNNNTTIDLSNLNTGIYFVKIQSETQIITKQIVKAD